MEGGTAGRNDLPDRSSAMNIILGIGFRYLPSVFTSHDSGYGTLAGDAPTSPAFFVRVLAITALGGVEIVSHILNKARGATPIVFVSKTYL